MSARARYAVPIVVGRIDLIRDGHAEIMTNLGDVGGATNVHVFTVVDGALRVVTHSDGSELPERSQDGSASCSSDS